MDTKDTRYLTKLSFLLAARFYPVFAKMHIERRYEADEILIQ